MQPPTRLGDYEVLGKLGSGGMGAVYRVRNVISDRVEAMKVLLPDLAGREDLAARFLREIKLLAALDHPNIAELRTAQTVDNQLVMIMELVEGQSLAQRLKQGPMAPDDALQVARQVLDALDYAHRQDVIHRDIKPANMMITPQGVVKLMDFGIARSARDRTLTEAGVLTGSLGYISPEQVKGGTPDARSDLYSLGVSLYEMVTGQLPFQGDNNVAVMFAHIEKAPARPSDVRPGLSPAIDALVLKAIAKDPATRFQTAREFRDAAMAASADGSRAPAEEAATAIAAVPVIPPIPPVAAVSSTPAAHETVRMAATPSQPAAPQSQPVAPQPQAAAAIPVPVPSAPLPAPRRVQGGLSPILYVALGALLVVAAIGGMAYYSRRAEATPPNTSATPAPAVPAAPAPSPEPAPAPPAEPVAATAPADAPVSTTPAAASSAEAPPQPAPEAVASEPAAKPVPTRRSTRTAASTDPAPAVPAARSAAAAVGEDVKSAADAADAAAAAKATEAAQLEEALDRLETELDLLSARVTAVNGTLDRLKAEQARAGYGLRTDMATRQQMLNTNLGKAEEALGRKDVARAERFKALAQTDLQALEKFIGR